MCNRQQERLTTDYGDCYFLVQVDSHSRHFLPEPSHLHPTFMRLAIIQSSKLPLDGKVVLPELNPY